MMNKTKRNLFYAQSGGATAVINASACGVIETARQFQQQGLLGKVLAGQNGIIGALNEQLIDTDAESAETIAALKHTPACAFGSCRYKLKPIDQDDSEYRQLIDIFAAHNIGYFLYNGGGDSQDTAYKVAQMSRQLNYDLTCIGIPKTIDNDLAHTDNSPGFGSVAKYIATSVKETALDVACMAKSSTKVFILEVMGRHAGWIAASAGLAFDATDELPLVICFPEIAFEYKKFLQKVQQTVNQHGYCVVVASEGIRNPEGRFIHEASELHDAFGHEQLGGIAPILARLIRHKLQLKLHWAVSDYLQRAARHIASQTDVDQAYALGEMAVKFALQGKRDVMLTLQRHQQNGDYHWHIDTVLLNQVANVETKMPRDYISADGFGITDKARDYLLPLIQGEAYPPFVNGLPQYAKLKSQCIAKKLVKATATT